MTYAYIALAFVVGLALAYIQGRSDGGDLVRGEYSQRDLADSRENQATYAAWNNRNRAKEQKAAREGQLIAKRHQEKVANVESSKLTALAALHDGTLRLRLTDSSGCETNGSAGSETAGTGRGDHGRTEGRFFGNADAAFLISEASRADAAVNQLSACQALVRADRQ